MREYKDKIYWNARRRQRRREIRRKKWNDTKKWVRELPLRMATGLEQFAGRVKARLSAVKERPAPQPQPHPTGGRKAACRRAYYDTRRVFLRFGRKLRRLPDADYRHYIALALLALSITAFSTVCLLSAERLAMAFVDLKNSFLYYLCFLAKTPYRGEVTSNILPAVDLQRVCPFSIDEFLRKLNLLGDALLTKEMFMRYVRATGLFLFNATFYIAMYSLPVVCLYFLLQSLVFRNVTDRKDTTPLLFWKKHIRPVFRAVFGWIRDFFRFMKDRGYEFWLVLIWLFNLNIVTMIIEFFAWYLQFCAAFSFDSIKVNLFRLLIDGLIMLWSAPWWFWCIVFWIAFDEFRRSIGYSRLRRHEAINAGVFAGLPVVALVAGTMGMGKTTCITDLGLTGQNYFRRKAQGLMFEIDMRFPNFPFQRFEDAIDGAHDAGVIFNLASIKPFIARKKRQYEAHPSPHCLYGYDLDNEAAFFDNDLCVMDLFSSLENYAKLYYLYTIESPLISSNYAVRCDAFLEDKGNYPLWQDDFFEQISTESAEREQYSHILDMDTLRTGKLMNPDNPRKGSKEIGIDLLSEMGKERGNAVENKHMKKDAETANPLNDGFNIRLKMHRHPGTVENFCFAKIIGDEQREESLGADARELAEIIKIREKSELKIAMPFYALGNLLFALTYDRFRESFYDLRHERGDNSLFLYFIKNLFCLFYHHHIRIVNRFGYRELTLERRLGTEEEAPEQFKYYLANKKIYSRRFKTDCYADLFNKQAERSSCGLEGYPQYADVKASSEELHRQNSYFMEFILNQFGTDAE